MADEKKAVPKAKKANFFVRFGNGFVNFFKKIGASVKNMWHELKKVTWPTKDKLINYTIIVVIVMIFLMVIIGLLDTGASALVNLIMSSKA
jgi:preprotein translocase subunit SecE